MVTCYSLGEPWSKSGSPEQACVWFQVNDALGKAEFQETGGAGAARGVGFSE